MRAHGTAHVCGSGAGRGGPGHAMPRTVLRSHGPAGYCRGGRRGAAPSGSSGPCPSPTGLSTSVTNRLLRVSQRAVSYFSFFK